MSLPPGRHRRRPTGRRPHLGPIGRLIVSALLAVTLFPALVVLGLSLVVRTTVTNPAYVMEVVRTAEVLPQVKGEFLTGLVEGLGLAPDQRTLLREALEEGVPVQWLDRQLSGALTDLAAFLSSGAGTTPSVVVSVAELKASLLAAVREHLGEEYYLQFSLGLQAIPDLVDIGQTLDLGRLDRLRPLWRGAAWAPLVSGGLALTGTALLALAAGGRARGLTVAGGVWLAAGVALMASSVAFGAVATRYLTTALPSSLPELASVSPRDLAVAALGGVRSHLVAVGAGGIAVGLALLRPPVAPRRAA